MGRNLTKRTAAPAFVVAVSLLLATAGTAQAAPPTVGGCQVFPSFSGPVGAPSTDDLSAWNQDIASTPRDRRSAEYMDRIMRLGGNQRLHPDFGGGGAYGIPFETVPAAQADVTVSIGPDGYPDESDFGQAPIPPGADIEGGASSDGDRHVIVMQQGSCELFELYRTFPDTGNNWIANATAHWDLGSAALRPEGWTSTDAAGLPILPGLVRYDEVAAGEVNHAIRVTFSRTRRGYIHPATHHASSRCGRYLPPMGLRLRLKGSWYSDHLGDFPAGEQARPVLTALRRYGMVVADNGSNFFITGEANPAWDDEELDPLKNVPRKAFVVVDAKDRVSTPC